MTKLWKIEITAQRYIGCDSRPFTYTGIATTAEVAIRQTKRKAKKDGLCRVEIVNVCRIGDKEFG